MDKEEKKLKKIEIKINAILAIVLAFFALVQATIQNPNDWYTRLIGVVILLAVLLYTYKLLKEVEKI